MDSYYVAMDVLPEMLGRFIEIGAKSLTAFNVTSPHKTSMYMLCTQTDDPSRSTQSVNLVLVKGKELHGFNTDVTGFRDLIAFNDLDVDGRRVAILGTGGAARAVYTVIDQDHTAEKLCLVSRSPERVRFPHGTGKFRIISYKQIPANVDLLVNALPPGVTPPVAIPHGAMLREFIELGYGKPDPDLLLGSHHGDFRLITGSEMYIGQAVETFRIVFGDRPENLRDLFWKYLRQFQELEA